MIRFEGVHKSLGGHEILKGVDLEIESGEHLVIIGRSGGGKSVLLRHVMGLLKPDQGAVYFQGKNLVGLSEREMIPFRREMAMLFQNGALFDSMTVGENVAFPLREQGKLTEGEISKEVSRSLELVQLSGQERKMPSELSGGMRKRVSMARAIIAKPKLLLYDEPTSGLDPMVADSINKLILRLGEEMDITAIVVTHDMVSAYEVGDRIAMLHQGRIYRTARPEEFQKSEDPVIYRFVRGISDASILAE